MIRNRRRNLVRLVLGAVVLGWLPVAAADRGEEPELRIALGEPRAEVQLWSESPIRLELLGDGVGAVYEIPPKTKIRFLEERAAGQAGIQAPRPLFRILVASSPSKSAAQRVARWVAENLPDRETHVSRNRERESWRVMVGAYGSRMDAGRDVPALVRLGLDTVWIVDRTNEEVGGQRAPRSMRVEWPGEMVVRTRSPVLVERIEQGTIRYDRRRYRGSMLVQPAPRSGLQVVNTVGMETYLRGVVQLEMGPFQFPNLDALKAQAVAARTYAYRHRGQFEALGFDLCDSQRCQVYGGASAEQPRTDRAIRGTSGLVLMHEGEPIRSYFTASCGGHTENVSEVFVEESEPYLRGVSCPPEEPKGWIVRIPQAMDLLWGNRGELLNFQISWLVAQSIAPLEALDPLWGWTRPGPEFEPILERAHAWSTVATRGGRGSSSIGGAGAIAQPAVGSPATRAGRLGDLASKLMAIDSNMHSGTVLRERAGRFRVRQEDNEIWLDLSSARFLFSRAPGDTGREAMPQAALVLKRGDRLEWLETSGGESPTLVVLRIGEPEAAGRLLPKEGSWEDPKSVADLLDRLGPRAGAFDVQGLVPLRMGPSGRVSKLLVETKDGGRILRGIRVRWGLGLRETLFRPAGWKAGDSVGAGFRGRGRGHGVGMCQRGAFGLAGTGWSYDRILAHYYAGSELQRRW